VDMDVDESAEVVDAEIVDEVEPESDAERWAREDAQRERIREHKRLTAGSRSTPPRDPERTRAEAEAIRAREAKPRRSTSTADPYADRYETPRSRRSMSPKRYAERQKDKD